MDKTNVKTFYEKKVFYVQNEFIKDFLFFLLDKIEKTYLGDEIMNMENKRDHFEWSVNETVLNFKKEEIHVNVSKDFISKLFDIFNMYYYSLKKNRNTVEDLKIRYTNIFNSSISKTPAQIEETVFYVRLFTSHMGNSF
jgi:hypothetical protein